jgi:hypothetical protein
MKLAICIKEDKDPFGYKFKLYEKYKYHRKEDKGPVLATPTNSKGNYSYYVINNYYLYDTHCAYDQEHFDEYFIDLQQYRKLKLNKLNESIV